MKRIALLIPFLLTVFALDAQVYVTPEPGVFGIKISYGAVISREEVTYVGNSDDFLIYEVAIQDTKPVLQIGAFSHKKFGYLWLEGSLMYTKYGNEYQVKDYIGTDVPVTYYDETFHYMDFQVLSGVHANNFRIGVGPVIHILADHNNGLVLPDVLTAKLRPLSFGFSGNVGYDLGLFKFDVKFESAFRSVGDHIYYNDLPSRFKGTPDMLTLSVAFGF